MLGNHHRLRRYQVVHVNYVWYAPLLRHFGPDVLKVLDSHDVFADRAQVYRQAGLQPAWFSTSLQQEDEAFGWADAVLAIQRDEARAMAARGHGHVLFLPYLEPLTAGFTPRRQGGPLVLGYLGSGNDWNIRSLRAFLDAWQVRPDRPPVQLLVVLAPSLMPLIEPNAPAKPGAAPPVIAKAGGAAPEAAKPALQACGG